MTDDGWIPVASALALLNSRHVSAAPKALRNTLNCSVDVRSRGAPVIDGIKPIALGPEHWSTMVFNLERQSLDPPSKRRTASGFTKVELSRSDVERLADRLASLAKNEPRPVDLTAVLTDARAKNPNLTGEEAFKIARERGATEGREIIREVLKSMGGSDKTGPKGPRKNRAAPAA